METESVTSKPTLKQSLRAQIAKVHQRFNTPKSIPDEDMQTIEKFALKFKEQHKMLESLKYLCHKSTIKDNSKSQLRGWKGTICFERKLIESLYPNITQQKEDVINENYLILIAEFFKDVDNLVDIHIVSEIKCINEISKQIKKANKLYQDYIASQTVLKKATESSQDSATAAKDHCKAKFETFASDLNSIMPKTYEKVQTSISIFATKYFRLRVQFLKESAKFTEKIQKQLSDTSVNVSSNSIDHSAIKTNSVGNGNGLQAPKSKVSNTRAPTTLISKSENFRQNTQPESSESSSPIENQQSPTKPQFDSLSRKSNTDDENAITSPDKNQEDLDTTESRQTSTSSSSSHELTPPYMVMAKFRYDPEHDDELHFNINERIEVLPWENIEFKEEGWHYGRNTETNKTGLFPANYVVKIND